MHCSLEFTELGLAVAAHSSWNDAQTQCALHLFADHEHMLAFLQDLPAVEAKDFAGCMMHCALSADVGEEGGYCIEGVAALSLTNFLVHLCQHGGETARISEAPDLMGFWEPPGWRVPSEGIILWFHPDDGYRVVIPRGRDQAQDAIRRLSWLERQRRESLLAQINRWNAPRLSPHPMQEIRGVCAEVLCLASVAAAKIRSAVRTERIRQSALLN